VVHVRELDYFAASSKDVDERGRDHCPYIIIVMELGISSSVASLKAAPANANSEAAQKVTATMVDPVMSAYAPERIGTSATMETYTAFQNELDHNAAHPRCSVYLSGCSPSLYRVIRPHETDDYRRMLECGGLLGDHPRRELDTLQGVRIQKPFFNDGESFGWIVA
jgi:hypothetical protein